MNIEEISSKQLIAEIGRRFSEREATIVEMNGMMKKMEEMNKRLLKAEENKSKFMSIIKNEFNNPLASMLLLSKSLLKTSADEKVIFIAKTLQEESLLLNFQINNIITAAEIESGTLDLQVEKINFQDLILQAKEELTYLIQNKQANLKINIFADNDIVSDKEKVYTILINLLSNGIEFSSSNANVEVEIFEEVDDFKIIVKDYGEGIEKKEFDKIFHRFHQAHSGMNRAHRGQGLGLSVIKDLVDFMYGSLKFDSKVGEYTIFEITLPKIKDASFVMSDDVMFSDFESESVF